MEKTFNKGVHDGYKIGEDILVHGHINDPESWFLTIKKAEMFGIRLCKKSCSEDEIASAIHSKLWVKEKIIGGLINQLQKFTGVK